MLKNIRIVIYSIYFGIFSILLFSQTDKLEITAFDTGIDGLIKLLIALLVACLIECCARYVVLFLSYLKSECVKDGYAFDMYLYLLKLAACIKLDIKNKLFVRDVIVIKNNDRLVGDIFLMNKYFKRIPQTGRFVDMSNLNNLNKHTLLLYDDLKKLNGDFRRSFIVIDLKEHTKDVNHDIFRMTVDILCWPVAIIFWLINFIKYRDSIDDGYFLEKYDISTEQIPFLVINWVFRFIIIGLYFIIAS